MRTTRDEPQNFAMREIDVVRATSAQQDYVVNDIARATIPRFTRAPGWPPAASFDRILSIDAELSENVSLARAGSPNRTGHSRLAMR